METGKMKALIRLQDATALKGDRAETRTLHTQRAEAAASVPCLLVQLSLDVVFTCEEKEQRQGRAYRKLYTLGIHLATAYKNLTESGSNR